ncbi:unnamed protein product [Urochloa decumbens]|uniref:Uncharacterized protein n=1 Tax=Urochloa decumbens TaxID=240449 RepID=A0ABC9C015_9POAL
MGVMKPVLSKLATLMGDEYKKIKGLRKKVTFLQRELRDMDALLEKMDSADELDPQAKNWRKDIIEMSYNIEDCIDDFMQCIGQADNKAGILRKAFKYLRSFKNLHHLANQFEAIKAQVMEASERRKRYMLDQSISVTATVAVDPRLSAIYKESASLVGIDAQKIELINWAMDKEQQLKVMAIVGFGGLGKTTLANEVYREVGGKFDCKAFVSVSQKPEMIGLFNSLLSQLGLATYSHACQLQDPINTLREHLQNKSVCSFCRYFIVVDDLWDLKAWVTIQYAFQQNNQCSRVMITTRNGDLARSCCGNHKCIHNMRPLSVEDSKKLFFGRIFGSQDACPSELKEASSEILKRCDGLPLAIITMASLLACCQPTRLEGQWEYIKNALAATKFAPNSDYEDMMYILNLSYKNLPRHLKACFLYLGSYPEDHEIDRVQLVWRWVAEGFVSNSAGQDVWDVADSYFNELVNRCMIQPTYDDDNIRVPIVSGCRVHDMLLDLIVTRCKEDNFLSLVNDHPQAVLVEVQDKAIIRRLNVVGSGREDDKVAVTTAVNLAHIRSLSILGGSNWIPSLHEFKFVRVLSLEFYYGTNKAIDLTLINQLSQLRYVKVNGWGSKIMLPCQIQGLRLLETLDLSGFGVHGSSISLEIDDAPRLFHLIMPDNSMLPDWIGRIKSLRTLSLVWLPKDSLEGIVGLGELAALSDLSLYFPEWCAGLSSATWMAALSTSLDKLSNLKRLRVYPNGSVYRVYPNGSVYWCCDALSSFSPPFLNLLELVLYGCTFSRVPRWIGCLCSLRNLWLGAKHVLQEDIDVIGTKLPSLLTLTLRIPGIPTGRRIVIVGSTGFSTLKMFCFDCDGTSFLTFEAGAMPALRELRLMLDPDGWDKAAPAGLRHLPASLEKITIFSKGVVNKEPIRSVFQEAADAHPTRPALTVVPVPPRCREEDDY